MDLNDLQNQIWEPTNKLCIICSSMLWKSDNGFICPECGEAFEEDELEDEEQ